MISASIARCRRGMSAIRTHWLMRKASWLLMGQGVNFLVQALYFILLARLLGVRQYGIFAGANALVNIIAPYSKLGSNLIYMRYVTADRSKAPVYWGNALFITTCFSFFFAAGLALVGPRLTSIPDPLIFAVLVLANCWFTQIASMASTVFQTVEKMRLTATLNFITNLARLLILVLLVGIIHRASALKWSFAILVASAIATIPAMLWVHREVGA